MENIMPAIPRGQWTVPKPSLCTSSAPGPSMRGSPLLFPTNAWIAPLMQQSSCQGLQLLDAGQRMERPSLAGLNPGTSSCTQPRQGTRPVHTSQQSKNLTLCWSHLGCKAPSSSSSPQNNQKDAVKDGFGHCHSQRMLCRPSSKAEVLLGHPQLPPQPPQASRTQPAADRE